MAVLFVLSAAVPARAASGDEWLGEDKAKHFAACFTLAGAGYGGGALLFEEPGARWLTGAGLAMGAGLGKELYDSRRGGTGFSLKDLAWDAVGTATGLGVAYLVDRLVFGRNAPAVDALPLRPVTPWRVHVPTSRPTSSMPRAPRAPLDAPLRARQTASQTGRGALPGLGVLMDA